MSTAPPQQLNVRETARRLGVHENTVRNWAERGILRASRLPGSGYRRFAADDVDHLAREMRGASAPVEDARVGRPKSGQPVGRDAWQ